jgi:hypothetical protein
MMQTPLYSRLEEATTAVAKLYKESPGDTPADVLPKPVVYKSKEPLEAVSTNKKGEKDIKIYDSRFKPVLKPLKKQVHAPNKHNGQVSL